MRRSGILKARALIRSSTSLLDIINERGLARNLLFCLDAGDSRSYKGDGSWYDLSNNNNHFTLGDGSGIEARVPLFTGSLGALSENEGFVGKSESSGGGFQLPSSTFANSWHKNNGTFSFICVFVLQSALMLFNNVNTNSGTALNNGFNIYATGANLQFGIDTNNTAGAGGVARSVTNRLISSRINFAGVSFNENGNTIVRANGGETTAASTASTNTTDPSFPLAIGARADSFVTLASTSKSKILCCACWSTALSASDLSNLYDTLKQKRYLSCA